MHLKWLTVATVFNMNFLCLSLVAFGIIDLEMLHNASGYSELQSFPVKNRCVRELCIANFAGHADNLNFTEHEYI